MSNAAVPQTDVCPARMIKLEVLTLAPPPQRLSDAEVPLWEVLEARSGKESMSEQISAKEGAKPSCGG